MMDEAVLYTIRPQERRFIPLKRRLSRLLFASWRSYPRVIHLFRLCEQTVRRHNNFMLILLKRENFVEGGSNPSFFKIFTDFSIGITAHLFI